MGRFIEHRIADRRLRRLIEKWLNAGVMEDGKRTYTETGTIREQGRWLGAVVRGYFAYHAVPTNLQALGEFRTEVVRWWLRMLRRRSQKHRLTWRRFVQIVDCWLPRPKPLHPFPEVRFAARTQGKSRMQ